MSSEVIAKLDSLYKTYLNASCEEKEVLKYKFFEEAENYLEIVLAYILLHETLDISYDFGYVNVTKGTNLYRIRNYNEMIDFSNECEWQAPPKKIRKQGRMNTASEEALYLASSEDICLKETSIKKNQSYVLGKYEVLEDIMVGGFYGTNLNPKLMDIHRKLGMILNAFLIAPNRSTKNTEIFNFLDKFYDGFNLNDLKDRDDIERYHALKLPLKFAKVPYFNNCYYDLTNSICAILKEQYPSGIRYSSCYKPLDTNQILSNDYNLVLYNSSIKKVRFIKYEIRTSTKSQDTLEIVEKIAMER